MSGPGGDLGWLALGYAQMSLLAATLGMIGPSSLLTGLSAGAWHRFRERPWRRRIQAALVPVTVGLIMAGAGLLVASTAQGAPTAGITLGVTAAVLATRVHPLALLAAGAAAGVVFGAG